MAEFKGIDVSYYNGTIDFAKVKAAGYSFAILRAGWCGYDGLIVKGKGYDTRFDTYIKDAIAAGINVGVYVYSYAKTPEAAKVAAQQVLAMVKPYKLTMPIFWDYEDRALYASFGKAKNNEICKAFLDEIERNKYYAMLYTYTSFADSYLDMSRLQKYDLWIADYRGYVGYKGAYGIWQYTSSGSVPGVSSARCDLNTAYRDYPAIIKAAGLNGLTPAPVTPPSDVTVELTAEIDKLKTQLAAAQDEIAAKTTQNSLLVNAMSDIRERIKLVV